MVTYALTPAVCTEYDVGDQKIDKTQKYNNERTNMVKSNKHIFSRSG